MNFLYILLALFIFGILIFIHELGHFLVARMCGVKILEFAIGMGPKLVSWKSQKSGTRYALRLFPIGGFVSMLGENGMEAVQGSGEDADAPEPRTDEDGAEEYSEEEAAHAYCNQSVWKRILISLAGPMMNILLGFLLMLVIVLAAGQQNVGTTEVTGFYVEYAAETEQNGMLKNDYVYAVNGERIYSFAQLREAVANNSEKRFAVSVVRYHEEDGVNYLHELTDVYLDINVLDTAFRYSVSENTGLCVGDEILKVNGTRVHTYYELAYEIMNQGYRPVDLTVRRNGQIKELAQVAFPNISESGATLGEVDFMIRLEDNFGIGTVLKHTWFRSVSMVKMVFDSIAGLLSGRYGVEAVSGPVGITKTISDVAKTGFLNVISLITIISINLGVMNLLPLPALDGGHLLMYLIEAIRRKPVKPQVEGMINFIGLILLLSLAVIIAVKDIIAL